MCLAHLTADDLLLKVLTKDLNPLRLTWATQETLLDHFLFCIVAISTHFLKVECGGSMENLFFETSTTLIFFMVLGAPEKSRTSNLQIRNLALYPIELRAHFKLSYIYLLILLSKKSKEN